MELNNICNSTTTLHENIIGAPKKQNDYGAIGL